MSTSSATIGTRRWWSMALAGLLFVLLTVGGFELGRSLAPSATQPDVKVTGPIPPAPRTAAVANAADQAVGMISSGCGDPALGSGFALGHGYFVTNAHVVAGTTTHMIVDAAGDNANATVVQYDPDLDVAVLYAPGLSFPGIKPAAPRVGMLAAFIGFPGGQNRHISGARVSAVVTETDRDIYRSHDVSRQVMWMRAGVHNGDSGSPVVNAQGRYVGMVYGYSAIHPNIGFAVTSTAMQSDVQQGMRQKTAASTGQCMH